MVTVIYPQIEIVSERFFRGPKIATRIVTAQKNASLQCSNDGRDMQSISEATKRNNEWVLWESFAENLSLKKLSQKW